MAKKTSVEMAKALGVKRIKAQVRLELSCRADLILNELMDDFDKSFAKALADGTPIELTGYQEWVRNGVDKRLPLALVAGS